MKKYPALYVYRKSGDGGRELRYSLRSLKNIKNFDGQVFVVGDSEEWFKNITHIKTYKNHFSVYRDAEFKMLTALLDDRLPDDFILMNDDFYILEPTTIQPLHGGEIETEQSAGYHRKALLKSRSWLTQHGVKQPLNYAIHVPMIMNKKKRLEVHDIVLPHLDGVALLPRVIYGNLFEVGGEYYQDRKTRGDEMLGGALQSTLYFTPELEKVLPDKSPYEGITTVVYDDSELEWSRRYSRLGRMNGAKSYTGEIIKYQVPIWQKYADDITISTTNLLSRIDRHKSTDVYVQYLHTYPKDNPQKQVREVVSKVTNPIFVVAYEGLYHAIQEMGYRVVYIPMTIDGRHIPKATKTKNKSIVYYGNITDPKIETFNKLKQFYEAKGWQFDYISNGQFNGQGRKLTQTECWDIIKDYKYGIGVGRCYMEMAAMGLKCIIAGNNIGGITLTKADHDKQVKTNYNSNYFTVSDDLDNIHKQLPKVKPQYEDIRGNVALIEERIKAVLCQA